MVPNPKEEITKREQAQKERLKFIQDAFAKFWQWQLEHNIVAYPFLMGPWGGSGVGAPISAEIGFRKMEDDERKMIQEQLARQAGIEVPQSGIIKPS